MRESERLERTVEAIARPDYGAQNALAGWLYAARLEHQFIDGDLVPLPVRRRAQTCPITGDVADLVGAASSHVTRLAGISNVTELWAALQDLVTLDASAMRDDGVDPATLFSSDDNLNIVVIGAGPIGLALASALRHALGPSANVLIIENRVASPHQKLPYARRWLTAIDHETVARIVEAPVREIFAKVGTKHIGVTIDVLETLLLLSCRRMGVRFLFSNQIDLAFVGDRPVHIVFDATGNRLQQSPDPNAITISPPIGIDTLQLSERLLASYGVDLDAPIAHPYIHMASSGDLRYPLHRGRRLTQALFKITQVPARMCDALVELVVRHNQDNKHYVWRGSLRDEINQGLVLVNLTRAEYEALCVAHEFPLGLAEAVASSQVRAALDPRTIELFSLITDRATPTELARIEIDAPFTWQPYWIDERMPARLHGTLLVRVGDSIYNGNVKLANGMGPHLRHLVHVQQVLWAHATGTRAERIARTMGCAR